MVHYLQEITMRAAISRTPSVILIIAISGCGGTGQLPSALPAAAPAAFSFDGTYTGTIRLTSSGMPANPNEANRCDTPPQISLIIQNNAFTYHLTHPNVPKRLSLTIIANVAPDGSISGSDVNGEAIMDGLIGGSQIAGHINGTACNYAFTANRV
jgi:hypothetical protein